MLTLFAPLDSYFTSFSSLFFLAESTIIFCEFFKLPFSIIVRHYRFIPMMATMSRRASADNAVDRSSASSAAADAREADTPKCVLHDGAISPKLYVGKKVVIPCF